MLEYIKEKEFCFTYGDGLADINISQLIESHKNSGKLATVTAVKPPGRFGSLEISDTNTVEKFQEKIDGSRQSILLAKVMEEPE